MDDVAIDFWTAAAVEARLLAAFAADARLPDRERAWRRVKIAGTWRQMRSLEWGDYRPEETTVRLGLRTAEVDAMDEALGWTEWLGEDARRLVARVIAIKARDPNGRVPPGGWGRLRKALGLERAVTVDALKAMYARALAQIVARLDAAAVPFDVSACEAA